MLEADIKQVLFRCKSQEPDAPVNPKGLYCDNLDVIEFADLIEAEAVKKERAACVAFVKSLNHLVATALEDKRSQA